MESEVLIGEKISAANANVSCFSSITEERAGEQEDGGFCEREGQTGCGAATGSFYGASRSSVTLAAESGTGTICFAGENPQSQMETPGGAAGEGVAGSRSLLDSLKKEEVKASAIPASFRGSRFKPIKPLLGRPRRVLRADDSTGSDESIEVADNHQNENKEKTPGLSKLQLLNGLKEELQILRIRASSESSARSSSEHTPDDGGGTNPSSKEDSSPTPSAEKPQLRSPVEQTPATPENKPGNSPEKQPFPGKSEAPAAEKVPEVSSGKNPDKLKFESSSNSSKPGETPRPSLPETGEVARESEASRRGAAASTASTARENANFVWVNNKRYQKLGKIGSGGSSHVFKVIAQDCTIYALKRIILKGRDHQTACGFHQEIDYLERLRGKRHIIQLIDYEVTDKNIFRSDYAAQGDIQNDVRIYMVLEYGEIDLARMLDRKKNEDGELDENWLRLYWEHILKAVNTIHEERIVHADLKPANFLLVQGALKLIDFGIAKAIQNDTTNIVREAQVGTLNYMSPEAFMMNSRDENGTVKCGRSSDIWSLGCILYQMVYGRTPFSHLNFYQKITEITNPKHVIDFPPVCSPVISEVMRSCLQWDKSKRPRIPQLLEHPFLRPRPPENLHHHHHHREDDHQQLREALLQSCKAYVAVRGRVELTELIRKLVKGSTSSFSCSLAREEPDDVLLPFVRLYMQKAGKPALHELLTPLIL